MSETWGSYLFVYLYDADGSPIGMQCRVKSMAEGVFYTLWFEKNLQGDIVAVYDDAGNKLYSYAYDAWGNCVATRHSTSTAARYAQYNPFRYRGYYYDTETGFYYLQSRYYDPNTGRFVNADGQLNGGLLGYNQFAYCENNPVMYVDPYGGFFVSITLVCVAAFAAIGATAGGIIGYQGAKSAGVDEEDLWKYAVGGAVVGGVAGGIAGYVAAPAISAATGVAGISVTSAGVTVVGAGGAAAEQAAEGVYYQVTSQQAAQSIAQSQTLIPSASEQSVCVLNFQPTLEQAKQIGARAYETVIRFQTNSTTWEADMTVAIGKGAYRNIIDGVIKVFDVVEVGFK